MRAAGRSRRGPFAMLLSLVACGGGSTTPSGVGSTGSGAGSAPAPTPTSPACLPLAPWHAVSLVHADDRSLIVCTAPTACRPSRPTCVGYDLATGARTAVMPPTLPSPPAYTIVEQAKALELCGPGGACTTLPFVATGTSVVDHQLHVAVGPGERIAAIAGEKLDAMYLVDVRTTKVLARATGEARDGNCLAEPYFLGDVIYARACGHSFPMHTDYLFRTDGTRIGILHGVAIAPGDRPVQVAGSRWAVHLEEGDGYLVFDAATGERVRTVPEKPAHVHGDAEHVRRGPLRTPAGKLIVLGEALTISDPITGAIEQTWPLPFCAADPAARKPRCP